MWRPPAPVSKAPPRATNPTSIVRRDGRSVDTTDNVPDSIACAITSTGTSDSGGPEYVQTVARNFEDEQSRIAKNKNDWRHRAICRREDPEAFFPVSTSGPALLQIAEAKTICRRCPVVSECLTWALQSGQDAGVWGGMSEDERLALKRRNARTGARTV